MADEAARACSVRAPGDDGRPAGRYRLPAPVDRPRGHRRLEPRRGHPDPAGQRRGRSLRISPRGGALLLSDAGSATGTFVNGEKIEGEQPAPEGDRICLGPPGAKGSAKLVVRLPGAQADAGPELRFETPALLDTQAAPSLIGFGSEASSTRDARAFGGTSAPVAVQDDAIFVEDAPAPAAAAGTGFRARSSRRGGTGHQRSAGGGVDPAPTAAGQGRRCRPRRRRGAATPRRGDTGPPRSRHRHHPARAPRRCQPPPRACATVEPRLGRRDRTPASRRCARSRAARSERRRDADRGSRVCSAAFSPELSVPSPGWSRSRASALWPRPAEMRPAPDRQRLAAGDRARTDGHDLRRPLRERSVRQHGVVWQGKRNGVRGQRDRAEGQVPPGTRSRVAVVVQTASGRSNAVNVTATAAGEVTGIEPDVALDGPERADPGRGPRLGVRVRPVRRADPTSIERGPDGVRVVVPNLSLPEGSRTTLTVQAGSKSQCFELLIGHLPLLLEAEPKSGRAGQKIVLTGRGFDPEPRRTRSPSGGNRPSCSRPIRASCRSSCRAAVRPTSRSCRSPSPSQDAPRRQRSRSSSPAARGTQFRPSFFPDAVPELPGQDVAFVSTVLGPVFLLGGPAGAGSAAARAEGIANALNALVDAAPAKRRRSSCAKGAAASRWPAARVRCSASPTRTSPPTRAPGTAAGPAS